MGFNDNSIKIFTAASKLKLDVLKAEIGKILCIAVNPETSFEMLNLASKHNHDALKKISFGEFKKLMNDQSLKDELMDNLEALKNMLDIKNAYQARLDIMKKELEEAMKCEGKSEEV